MFKWLFNGLKGCNVAVRHSGEHLREYRHVCVCESTCRMRAYGEWTGVSVSEWEFLCASAFLRQRERKGPSCSIVERRQFKC